MPAASRPTRVLWIVVASVFTVLTIGFGTVQAVAAVAHEERDVRTVVDDPVRVLDVAVAGSVTVIGTRDGRVTVEEHISRGLRAPDRSIRVDGDVLTVRGTCDAFPQTWCSDDVVIRVPADVRVVADAERITVRGMDDGAELVTDGGSIDVVDTGGALRLSSHGGSVNGAALAANFVDAASDGGNISLAFAVPPDHVDAVSHGGHVFVAVPDNRVTYRVETSASGGSAETLVRTDPDSDRTIRAESDGGDVTVLATGARQEER